MKGSKIDTEIKRINRQITQAARIFGTDSRLYQHYETILSGGASEAGLTRTNKTGLIQLSRSKSAISEIQNITAYQKMLFRLSNTQTVAKQKEMILMRYEERTGEKPKTRAEKEKAIAEYYEYNTIEFDLFDKLQQVYKLQKEEGGVEYKGMTTIKKLSKGHETTTEQLKEMLKVADKIVSGEDREIIKNAGFHRW